MFENRKWGEILFQLSTGQNYIIFFKFKNISGELTADCKRIKSLVYSRHGKKNQKTNFCGSKILNTTQKLVQSNDFSRKSKLFANFPQLSQYAVKK